MSLVETENRYSYKSIIKMATPIILGILADNIISTTDAIYVGRLGEVELSAVGLGGIFYYAFILFASSLSYGSQIIFARRFGEKRFRNAGVTLDNATILFFILGFVLLITLALFSRYLLSVFVQNPQILELTYEYVTIRSYSIILLSLAMVYRSFFLAINDTKVILFITASAALLNIILDYIFIFGIENFEGMGTRGSAIASAIAEGLLAISYILVLIFNKKYRRYYPFKFIKIKLELIKNILKVGLPLMVQGWLAVNSWLLFFIWIENLGTFFIASSMVIKTIYIILLMPTWGIGAVCSTLISNALGEGKPELMGKIIRKSFVIAFVLNAFLFLIGILFPTTIISFFTDSENIINNSTTALYMVLSCGLIFAFGHIHFAAVAGKGHTKASLVIELATISMYIVYAWIVTHLFTPKLEYIWAAEYVYMTSLLIFSVLYLFRTKGKFKVV
jgi:putative MATE family efflux protein